MARSADDRAGILRSLPGLLTAPSRERTELALRLGLICALTALVTEYYQTPDAALTTYLAFFLNRPDRTTSLILSIAFTLVMTLVIGLILLLATVVLDQPGWRVTAMAIVSLGFLFLGSSSKLKPLASTMALIAAYGLDVLGGVPAGEVATRALLYVWLFVGIPASVTLVVNLLIGPSPRRMAGRAIADRLHAAATLLRAEDEAVRRRFTAYLRGGVAGILGQLHLAGIERSSPKPDLAALGQAAHSTTEILFLVDALAGEASLPEAWRHELAATLDAMAAAHQTGGYPVDITMPALPDPGTLSPLAAALTADLDAVLRHFAIPPTAAPAPPAAKAKGGFFLPDAFSNPAHIRYALKTTAAAMTCYLIYSLLDWTGIHTCLITCYIVALGTTAETVEKLGLRIAGCLVGAAVGIAAIVFVMPSVESIGALMTIVFVGGLAAGWVAAGGPRISYAGFQIAFAFFLCVIQGASPAFDLTIARDRTIGILFGNLTVYLIFTNLWPVSVSRRIDPAIQALLRRLSAIARQEGRAVRRSMTPATQMSVGALEADLALVRYEPTSLRLGGDWLGSRHRAAEAMASLEGPLLLSEDAPTAFRSMTARRLDALADRFGAPAPPPADDKPDAAAPADSRRQKLHDIVNNQLDVLEQALAH